MKEPIPCIICHEQVDKAVPEHDRTRVQPSDATRFDSYGHYGSTLFDPMEQWLEGVNPKITIIICDECLHESALDGHVWYVEREPEPGEHPRTETGVIWESPRAIWEAQQEEQP